MKKKNSLFFFIVVVLFLCVENPLMGASKVRKNTYANKKKGANLQSFNSKREYVFRKEIVLDSNKNIYLFPEGHSQMINMLIQSVENKEIDAYTSEDLKKRMTLDILKKNLTVPINIENFYGGKNNKYFTGEEIKKIEIYGKYIKTVDMPQPIIENISVTLIIPAGTVDMTIERNVFTLKYNDFIKLLEKEKIYIEKDGGKILCSEAFKKIDDYFTYTVISVNNDFLKKTSPAENNKNAEKIFKKS